MAHVSSWLAKGVVQHDRVHGSNLEIARTGGKWLVQITKVILHVHSLTSAHDQFNTYRTPENPREQITGLISDKTHTVPVEFGIEATDEFERYVVPTDFKLTAG